MEYTLHGIFGDMGIAYCGIAVQNFHGRRIIDSQEADEVVQMLQTMFELDEAQE
jgi:hypothetical protein